MTDVGVGPPYHVEVNLSREQSGSVTYAKTEVEQRKRAAYMLDNLVSRGTVVLENVVFGRAGGMDQLLRNGLGARKVPG